MINNLWGEMSVQERFGEGCVGLKLLAEIFKLYQVPKPTATDTGKQIVSFFVQSKTNPTIKVRNIRRHPNNQRWQKSMHLKCKLSLETRGMICCVRAEPWLVHSKGREPPLLAIGAGTITDAFYAALEDDPDNNNMMLQMSLEAGIEARIFHEDCWVGGGWPW
jgi:hypothetical protein